MKGSLLSLKEKAKRHCFSFFQIALKYKKYSMTDRLNIIVDVFFQITGLLDRDQLSVYSIRALVHNYFVTMNYRLIYFF